MKLKQTHRRNDPVLISERRQRVELHLDFERLAVLPVEHRVTHQKVAVPVRIQNSFEETFKTTTTMTFKWWATVKGLRCQVSRSRSGPTFNFAKWATTKLIKVSLTRSRQHWAAPQVTDKKLDNYGIFPICCQTLSRKMLSFLRNWQGTNPQLSDDQGFLSEEMSQWGKLRKAFVDGAGYANGKQTANLLHKTPILATIPVVWSNREPWPVWKVYEKTSLFT